MNSKHLGRIQHQAKTLERRLFRRKTASIGSKIYIRRIYRPVKNRQVFAQSHFNIFRGLLSFVADPTFGEVELDSDIKNNTMLGSDNIPKELLKFAELAQLIQFYEIFIIIWRSEEFRKTENKTEDIITRFIALFLVTIFTTLHLKGILYNLILTILLFTIQLVSVY